MEFVIGFFVAWKAEMIAAVILVALIFLKKHYDQNVVVGRFISQAVDAIATKLEEDEATRAGEEFEKLPAKTKKQRRAKIRKDMAKAARRANRGTSKGNKNGGGKVK